MHPAPSVILFSTSSGAGFGLLFWLGLGLPAVTGWAAFWHFALAYGLAVGGLLASTFHLGHPERAWRAASQWRSSWLSREALCSVAALLLLGIYAGNLVFFGTRWTVLGMIGAVLSLATVGTTAMIYAQLRTVPRWHTPVTPGLFLTLSLAGGAVLAGHNTVALVLLLLAAGLQILWWQRGDTALGASGTDIETATGLGPPGKVRPFEPPHTGTNYLLREFVYVLGRKHARKLRTLAFLAAYVVPLAVLMIASGWVPTGLAALSHLAGVAVSRWLFFAEAEHVVGLYYG